MKNENSFNITRTYKLLLAILMLASSMVFGSAASLTTADLQRLHKGEVIMYEQPATESGRTFDAYAIFDATPERTAAVISNYSRYPQFMPNVARIDVLKSEGNTTLLNYYLSLPLGTKKRYRLELLVAREGENTRIQWRMLDWPEVPEDERIGDTRGYWLLSPYNGSQTLVHYHVYTDPGHVPLGLGWLVDFMSENYVPDVLVKTREYVGNQPQEL